MPVRLSIAKLAASAVAPLTTTPQFSNALLESGATWAQDVNYLRDTYMEIHSIWERLKDPSQDKQLYTETEPHLRELLLGLEDVSKQVTSRGDVYRDVTNASHDAEIAGSYASAEDYGLATVYQSYAMMKLHRVLDSLTAMANKRKHGSRKVGYGYDVSGEVQEGGGTSGQDNHLWDSAQPQDHHETKPSPVNLETDFEAEQDFPELAEFKSKRVEFPARMS